MEPEETNTYGQLEELGGSDYEIVDGQPNIKGWDVKDESGRTIGVVDELLFSPEIRKVRYLIVDTESEIDEDDRRVLIPIGLAELHPSDDDVIIPGITVEQLAGLPMYEENGLSADAEYRIRSVFENGRPDAYSQSTYDRGEFYTHSHFDDQRIYASRIAPVEDITIPVEEGFAGETDVATTYGNTSGTPQAADEALIFATEDDGFSDVPASQAENDPNYTGDPARTAGASPRDPATGDTDSYNRTQV